MGGVCLQGSRQPPEKVPVSRLGKLSGAHAAGRTPFGQVRSCSRRTFQRAVPRDTSSQAGAPVWATSKGEGSRNGETPIPVRKPVRESQSYREGFCSLASSPKEQGTEVS